MSTKAILILMTAVLLSSGLWVGDARADAGLALSQSRIDSSYTGFKIEIDTTAAQDSVDSLWFMGGTANAIGSATHWDSVFTPTIPDSLVVTGLTDSTKYYYWVVGADSTGVYDTTAVDSITLGSLLLSVSRIDSSYVGFTVEIDTTAAMDSVDSLWFMGGTANAIGSATHWDSVFTPTIADTLTITGLTDSTKYYYWLVGADSTGSYDTTAVDSIILGSLLLSLTVIDSSSDYFTIEIDTTAAADSVDSLWILIGTTNPPTTHTDSTFTPTIADTLTADGLTPATKYYFRGIGADSAGSYDTTAVDSFTTATVGDIYIHASTIYDGYSTAGIWVDWATPDSGFHPKKTILYLDKTTGLTRYDSIQTTSHTDPDTFAVTGLDEGVTYYYTLSIEDSGGTTYYPSDRSALTFTTTDLQQVTTLLYDGYSTAGIEYDSAGVFVAALDSIILQYGKVSGTYTLADTITSVTSPDTSKLTGLDEGVTYYYRSIVYLADSSAIDTLTEASFTTTDLSYTVTQLRWNIDSLFLKVDTVGITVDSLILQYGAGSSGITATADTITTVTAPDTFVITGLVEGGVYSYRLLAFLPDSSAIDTGTAATYTKPHNVDWMHFTDNEYWPSTMKHRYLWETTGASTDKSTGPLPINSNWIRINAAIDGDDDVSTGDSIAVYIWSWKHGDSTVIDTLITLDPDTVTITPLKYRMSPSTDYSDSSLALYPPYDWGTHYSISAEVIDTTIYEDSTIGKRTVGIFIEEID